MDNQEEPSLQNNSVAKQCNPSTPEEAKQSNPLTPESDWAENYDGFHVPKNHEFKNELTALFNSPEFQLLKFGCKQFRIPFYLIANGTHLAIGNFTDPLTAPKIACAKLRELEPDAFVKKHLNYKFLIALYERINHRWDVSSKDIFSAYERLSIAYSEIAKNKIASTATQITKLWQCFKDLITFSHFLPEFQGVCHSGAREELRFFLFFDDKEQGYAEEAFDLNFADIFAVFDKLRGLYLCNNKDPEIKLRITADYQREAAKHLCYLNFQSAKSEVSLLSVTETDVIYRVYQTGPQKTIEFLRKAEKHENHHDLLALMGDIKTSMPKDNPKDQTIALRKLACDALMTLRQCVQGSKVFQPSEDPETI